MKPFTMQELNYAMNQLERGKAADTKGISAQMIKYSARGCKTTLTTMCTLRHQIPRATATKPNWRDTAIKVIHKSGEPSSPSIYRPLVRSPSCTNPSAISSPNHYNPSWTPIIFLTNQASDRATPRQTIFSRSSNSDRAEWHWPLRVAIDFNKAFDTVDHSSVWKASREQGVEEPYIQLLKKSSTTSNEQQCTLQAITSTLSGEPSIETC